MTDGTQYPTGRKRKGAAKKAKGNGANLGFEEKLWLTADKLRGHLDPAEYKHVVLGLVFLKYISDAFEERRTWLLREGADPGSEYYVKDEAGRYAATEERDEYAAENIFWVPVKARWPYLQDKAKSPEIGKLLDEAMGAIEKDNPSLKGVLTKDYARPSLDKQRLGELMDLVGTIGLGDAESRSKDVLGRVYEYFLGRFASAEGKGGVGRIGDLAIYGQESNPTTWRLAKMNLAIRAIDTFGLGRENADSFHADVLAHSSHLL